MLALLTSAVVIVVLVVAGAQLASAGTPEAPELTDAAGDCAVPYGNEYLDIVAAWIDGETAETFDVHLKLAKWNEPLAEASGFTVQFTHQGLQWGIVGVFSAALMGGWEFSTGQASAELAQGFEDAPGAFDASTATITVTFTKSIFPHTDPNDTTLKDIVALSADLRPAMPFFVAGDSGVPVDGNGRWIVCDEAVGTIPYAFGSGAHSSTHTDHANMTSATPTTEESATQPETAEGEDAPLTPQSTDEKDTPLAPALVVVALALAALRRRA